MGKNIKIITNQYPLNVSRYNNINTLRAMSAIGIVLMHYQANFKYRLNMGWFSNNMIPWFDTLVFLFFMISGFTLCCGYYERMKNGQISMNDFYSKRYKRILPFFGLLCAMDVVMDFSKESLAQAFMNCTLVFNLLPNPDIKVIGVGWFLGVIFLFYMLFPFFVFLIDNKRRAWAVLGISLVINFLCQEYFFTEEFVNFDVGRHNILFSSPFLLIGGGVYLYRDRIHNFSVKAGNQLLAVCIAVNALYFVIPQSKWTLHSVIPLMAVFSLWLIYAMGNDHRWMHNKVMDFLSNISMEIYLCHMVMFRVVEKIHLENWIENVNILYFVTCTIGIGLAMLFSYYMKMTINRVITR